MMLPGSHPGEAEITNCSSDCDGQTQVDAEGHEDQHQTEPDPQLDEMKSSLDDVAQRYNCWSTDKHIQLMILIKRRLGAVKSGLRGVHKVRHARGGRVQEGVTVCDRGKR